MKVLVIIEPPPEPGKVWNREVAWFDTWKQAIDHVTAIAVGDDPGRVTILTVDT